MPSNHSSNFSSPNNDQIINGRYILHEEIGRGGMGIVYRATDRLTGNIIALKQITTLLKDPLMTTTYSDVVETEQALRLSLAQEFQILAGLRHPHIVSVLDYGFDTNQEPFFTMDYLPQATKLTDAAQGLKLDEKIDLLIEVVQALAYLHRHGVLHKDIKPSNILVSNGRAYLVDFGLSATEQQHSAVSGGTLLYMAPEVYHETEAYSFSSDLYSIGIVMYELLAGIHPFDSLTPESRQDPIDSSYDIKSLGLSPRLENVLDLLLQKQVAQRNKSAQQVLNALYKTIGRIGQAENNEVRESYLQAAKFVGRAAEMDQLTAALDQAKNGHGSAWLIGGESGVGKSRLLRELRTRALVAGGLVLTAQAKQEGSGIPFQLWREPLRQALINAPKTDDLTASVLRTLVPDIGQLLGRQVDPSPELNGQAAQLRLFNGITTLLEQIERPILLILEDLHWSQESLLPLSYLIQQIGEQSLMVVGSYRNDERPDLPDALSDMQLMTLDRLTAEMMTELSVAMLGEVGQQPEIIALLQRETEGNAFFAVEIVRALAEEVGQLDHISDMKLPNMLLPNGIQDIVDRRVGRLPQFARDLLDLAAVVGREIDVPLMQKLGHGFNIQHEWLAVCAETAVLEVNQNDWQFSHAKMRDGLLAKLSPEQAVTLHNQVATALEALYPDTAEEAGRLAYHWERAGNEEKAGQYAFKAGQHAASQFANEDAITLFDQALANTPADQLEQQYNILLAREEVYQTSATDRAKQQEDLTKLASLAIQLEDGAKQAEAALRQAVFFIDITQFDQAVATAEFAIQLGEKAGKELAVLDGYMALGRAFRQLDNHDVAKTHLEYCIKKYREIGELGKVGYALNSLGNLYYDLGQLEAEKACYEEALTIAQQVNDIVLEANLYNNLSSTLELEGDYRTSREYAEKALQLCKKSGALLGEGAISVNTGVALYLIGDYQRAIPPLKESITIFRKVKDAQGESIALSCLSLISERVGASEKITQLVEEGVQHARALNLDAIEGQRLSYLGFIYKQQGLFEQAHEIFDQALAKLSPSDDPQQIVGIRFHQARIAEQQQNWDIAQKRYLEALSLSPSKSIELALQSGLASIYYAQGHVGQAMAQIELVVINYLSQPLTDGRHNMRVAAQCYHILQAANDPRATQILQKAYETLQTRSLFIEDEESRRFALDGVPEHREVIRLYEEMQSQETAVADSRLSHPEGTINGRYILHEEIGRGGMGIVYRATDRLTGKIVALKQITSLPNDPLATTYHSDSNTDALRFSLAQEFQILSGLRHPHIVSVLDYGFDADQEPYFTMDYLPQAKKLTDAAQGLGLDEKIELLIEVVQALAYLHRRGVLHKDIKPSNILVSNGRAYLVDFGLSATEQQHSAVSGGTLLYMAPEVYHQTEAYNFSSDLYSIGIVMYELLAGHHPFDGLTPIKRQDPIDASYDLDALDLSPSLEKVLYLLLQKQVAQRYKSAQQTLNALYEASGRENQAESDEIRESYLQAAKFVGRETEMGQLKQALQNARYDGGSVWLVGGESGVGKSRLLDEFRTYALVSGWRVLNGQAVLERSAPYQIWRDIILDLVLHVELGDFEAGVLQEIVPSIGRLLAREIPQIPRLDGEAYEQRLTFTLMNLLKRQSQPILLVLEDMQWAREGVAPVQQILKVLDQLSGIMVLGSFRHDESPNLGQELPNSQQILLERLSDTEITELSEAILGEAGRNPELVSLLTQETEGNTFFVVEVMRALAEEAGQLGHVDQLELPEEVFTSGMDALLQRRVQQVPVAAQPLLRLAAVAGRELDLVLLQALIPSVNIANWLQQVSETSVLGARGNQWFFSHDKIRQAILHQLDAKQYKALHRQVASTIEEIYPDDPQQYPLLLSLWGNAEDQEKEVFYLEPVVEHAIRITYDQKQARALLARGLALVPEKDPRHIQFLNYQAENDIGQGHLAQGIETAQKAQALATEIEDRQGLANSLSQLGDAAYHQADAEAAESYHQQSLSLWREMDDQWGIAQSLHSLGRIYVFLHVGYPKGVEYFQESLAIRQEINDQAGIANCLGGLGGAFYYLGDIEKSKRYDQQCLSIRRAINDIRGIGQSLMNLGLITQHQGDLAKAVEYNAESMTIFQMIGDAWGVNRLTTNTALNLLLQGEYESAREHLQKLLVSPDEPGFSRDEQRQTHMMLAFSASWQGDYQAATEHYQTAFYLIDDKSSIHQQDELGRNSSQLALWKGDLPAAETGYLQSLESAREHSEKIYEIESLMGLGEIYYEQGRYEKAVDQLLKASQLGGTLDDYLLYNIIYGMLPLGQYKAGRYLDTINSAREHFQDLGSHPIDLSFGVVHLAVAQVLADMEAGKDKPAGYQTALDKLTDITQLEATPIAYFEAADKAAEKLRHRHIIVLIAYGRYLIETGQVAEAHVQLEKAAAMAKDSQLAHRLREIEAVLKAKPIHKSQETINGRYILHEEIGRGGMGIVYRATDRLTGKIVALKQITTLPDDPLASTYSTENGPQSMRLALAQEFQILAGLRHPHIVSVLDYGFDANQEPYFTMDYLPAATKLTDAAQGLELDKKVELLIEVVQALAYLHRRGVLHKDIKPSNILVSNGRVYLVDFGLSATEQQHSAMSGGTLLYMAPEVYHKAAAYSFSSDLYSIGIVMYELLAGIHPFDSLTPVSRQDPIDSSYDIESLKLPPSLENVLSILLQKQVAHRYKSAQQVLNALHKAIGRADQAENNEIRESYLQAAKFVGRKAEMTQIQFAMQKALKNKGSAWLIGGESGVGKSRLISEIETRSLVAGFYVFHGQSVESGGLPYDIWRNPIRHLLTVSKEVDDLTASVILPLVPDISHLLNRPVHQAPPLQETEAQERLFTVITRLFLSLDQPALLVLEDLHWDATSLPILASLTRLIKDHKILVLASYTADTHPNLHAETENMQHLMLERLGAFEMAELSVAMLGEIGRSEAIQTFLQQETEGNAFFAVEVVQALAQEAGRLDQIGKLELPEKVLPNSILDVVERRFKALSTSNHDLLQKAAVVGREIDLPLISALAGDINVQGDWLPACSDAAILAVRNGAWQFSHNKIRQSLLDNMSAQVSVTLHAEVGRAIEQVYGDHSKPSQLAYHWEAALDYEKAALAYLKAGNLAASQFAMQEAINMFSHALRLTAEDDVKQRYKIVEERHAVSAHISYQDAVARDLDLLEELVPQLNNPSLKVGLLLKQSTFLLSRTRLDESLAKAEQAVSEATQLGDELMVAHARVLCSEILEVKGNYKEGSVQAKIALDFYESSDEYKKELPKVLNSLAKLAYRQEKWDEATQLTKKSENIAKENDDKVNEAIAISTLGFVLQLQRRQDGVDQNYGEALTIARSIGARQLEARMLSYLLGYAIDNLKFERAESIFYQIQDLTTELNLQDRFAVNLANMGLLNWLWGRFELSKRQCEIVKNMAERTGDKYLEASTKAILGRVYVDLGLFKEAQPLNEDALQAKRELNQTSEIIYVLQSLGYTASTLGHQDRAKEYFSEALKLSKEITDKGHEAEALVGLAQSYSQTNQKELATARIADALEILKDIPLQGYWAPFRTVSTLYGLKQEQGDGRIKDILDRAYNTLQERAGDFNNKEYRRQFLEDHPYHSRVIQLVESGGHIEQTPSPNRSIDSALAKSQDYLDQTIFTAEPQSDDAIAPELETPSPLLNRLLAISNHMAEIRALDPLLSYTISEVLSLVEAERGYIVLIDDHGQLEYRIKQRANGSAIISKTDPISHSILDEVIRTKKGLVVKNALLDPRFATAQSVVAMHLRSIMCAPLITKNKIIGAIYVENRARSGQFTENNLQPLEFFSNQAAVAIENAYINDNLENLVKQRTQELVEAKDAAEAANQAKTTFLSNMSHELRTPLNAILNFSGFIFDGLYGDTTSEQEVALRRVMDSGEHLLSLINDVLDLNKIEAGMMTLVFEEIDVNLLMQNTIATARGLVKDKDLELIADRPTGLPIIQADRRRVRQILLNVVSNAVKYTMKGHIEIETMRDEHHVIISIADTGIGIPPEDQGKVFESFVQARHNLENVLSTGLGLPITKQLVELHQGDIWFESEVDRGSTFFIKLPIKQ